MKNIGKPCARESHARFDEGGQAGVCSLLYLSRDKAWRFLPENFTSLTLHCRTLAGLMEGQGPEAGTQHKTERGSEAP
jgi:hypothetical protein